MPKFVTTANLHPDHVLVDVVEYLHVLVLVPSGLSDDLLHLTDQDSKNEHPGEPGEQHEDDLFVVLGVHFRIFPDRDSSFGSKEEALDVGVSNPVIDKPIGANPFCRGEHVVSTGQEMHQEDHDVDSLDHSHDCRYLRGRVPSVKSSRECILSQDTIDSEYCCPAFNS